MIFVNLAATIEKAGILRMRKIHIGQQIKKVLESSNLKKTEFATKIGLTRDGLYKILGKESIATDQLQKISAVLNHDFFSYYQTELNLVDEHESKYGFAAKEDVEELTKVVYELAKSITKMQQDLSKLTNQKAVKKSKGK